MSAPLFEEQLREWIRAEDVQQLAEKRFQPLHLPPEGDWLVPFHKDYRSVEEARAARFSPNPDNAPLFVLERRGNYFHAYDIRGPEAVQFLIIDALGRPPLPDVAAPGTLSRPSAISDSGPEF